MHNDIPSLARDLRNQLFVVGTPDTRGIWIPGEHLVVPPLTSAEAASPAIEGDSWHENDDAPIGIAERHRGFDVDEVVAALSPAGGEHRNPTLSDPVGEPTWVDLGTTGFIRNERSNLVSEYVVEAPAQLL